MSLQGSLAGQAISSAEPRIRAAHSSLKGLRNMWHAQGFIKGSFAHAPACDRMFNPLTVMVARVRLLQAYKPATLEPPGNYDHKLRSTGPEGF